jgi:type I restriction enzyme, S subunit
MRLTKVKLGDICTFKYGQMPRKDELAHEGYPVFSGYRVVGYSSRFHYGDPQIIIVARGVGGTGDVKMSPPRCFLTNLSIAALLKQDAEVDKMFLYYLLASTKLWGLRTGTAQAQITIERLQQHEVELPSLSVQRKIVSIVSPYDDLIENDSRRIKVLEQIAQMLYREWFVNVRFPGHEKVRMVESEMGKIPTGWAISCIGDFGRVITGKTPPKDHPEFFGREIPFIKLPDMHGQLFVFDTAEHLSIIGQAHQANKTLPPDSICVSCIGTAGIVVITTRPSQTNQQINSVVLNSLTDREFLYFRLLDLRETINRFGANGATMVNLNKTKFESLRLVLPPAQLLERYHKVVSSMFECIKNLQQRIDNLRSTRDLLLPKLVSGEISVQQIESGASPQAV